ncbi:Heat shock 70 kDa protein 4L [Orchesella cincta]|uniref:Heat shock 70 kDa protein 4L n=1 Tax=Orchesella cincta TaxID=48709 RepID=A0A1D2M955_ORCCI|nr:Heat shock 70 kDa protein 4L [Orchesella cincta]
MTPVLMRTHSFSRTCRCASRIPAIKRLVTRVFRKSPSKTLDIDEAVARGCALQSAILSPFPGSSSVIS